MNAITSSSEATNSVSYVVASKRSYWLSRGLGAWGFAIVSANVVRGGHGWAAAAGVIGFILFAALGLYALRQLLRTQARIRLGQDGIEVGDMRIGLIPWSGIEGLEMFGSLEAPFVALHVSDPGPYLARMPTWARVLAGVHSKSGMPLFSVSLIGIDRDEWELLARARALWAANAQAQPR